MVCSLNIVWANNMPESYGISNLTRLNGNAVLLRVLSKAGAKLPLQVWKRTTRQRIFGRSGQMSAKIVQFLLDSRCKGDQLWYFQVLMGDWRVAYRWTKRKSRLNSSSVRTRSSYWIGHRERQRNLEETIHGAKDTQFTWQSYVNTRKLKCIYFERAARWSNMHLSVLERLILLSCAELLNACKLLRIACWKSDVRLTYLRLRRSKRREIPENCLT